MAGTQSKAKARPGKGFDSAEHWTWSNFRSMTRENTSIAWGPGETTREHLPRGRANKAAEKGAAASLAPGNTGSPGGYVTESARPVLHVGDEQELAWFRENGGIKLAQHYPERFTRVICGRPVQVLRPFPSG